jgi:hypothetical protein
MSVLTGHCLCGSVSYSISAEPIMTALCHCKTCQRQTGSSYSLVVVVPRESLIMSGATLATYQTTTESTGTLSQRKFCSSCGSPVVTLPDATPALAIIKAGTLDDRKGLLPTVELHCNSAISYAVTEVTDRTRFPADFPG